ncbi:MAG TPA: hypothetical protein VGA89_01045 [Patescibacteria group bacterium]|jgi:hypothetical protein
MSEQQVSPATVALAAALGKTAENPGPKNEHELSPIGDILEFLINTTELITTKINALMDQLPENVKTVAEKFLSGDEEAYHQVSLPERSSMWKILSLLAMLSLFLSSCAPIHGKGQELLLRSEAEVVAINPSDWSTSPSWYLGRSDNCYLDPSKPVIYINISDNGGAYWVEQGSCSGWLPVTKVK